MRLFTLASFWTLLAAIGSYLLQLAPIPGIFLMMLGGPFLTGLLIDLFFAALLIEALTGRIPRLLAIVPLLAAGAYYTVYLQQGVAIQARNAELMAGNPRPGSLPFDASRMVLVDDDAPAIVRRYAVARAYRPQADQPQGYFVNLLAPRPRCDAIAQDTQVRIRKTYGAGSGMGQHFRTICDLSFPDKPAGRILTVTRSGDGRGARDGGDSETITEFRLDGALKARFRTVHTSRLASFPLFLAGCTLIDSSSSWACFTGFHKTRVTLGAKSLTLDRTAPERIVLGLHDYTDQELDSFQGYPENEKLIAAAAGVAKQVRQEVFATLRKALDDETTPLPSGMAYSISQQPEQLAPLARKMADRFNGFIGEKADKPPSSREALLSALAAGLAGLPPAEFEPLAPSLLQTLHRPVGKRDFLPHKYPMLYIRSGDAGAAAAPILKQDYQTGPFFPYMRKIVILAMCRAGHADAETIASLKGDFAKAKDDGERQALAVTLLKMGQRDFVGQNLGSLRKRAQVWMQLLLDGKGWNAAGPNNCMPMTDWDLNIVTAVPAVMQPLLVRQNGWAEKWDVRTAP